MDFSTVLVGVYLCIMFQIVIVGIINLFQKRKQNKILGFFCILIAVSLIKIAFGDYIKNSFLIYLVGWPHEMLYAPLLYTYLLNITENNLDKYYAKHFFIALGIYFLVHPLGHILYEDSYSKVVPLYSIGFVILNLTYIILGVKLFKNQLYNLKPYPKIRFLLFYISMISYLLIKAVLISFISIEELVNNTAWSAFVENISLPFFDYIVRPLFIILCLIYFIYAITEINWIKKYFLNLSIIEFESKFKSDTEIEKYLMDNKAYLNPNFNVDSFIKSGEFNVKMLKQFLKNNNYNNFSEFVNVLRVANFKEKLKNKNYNNFDLYSIAKESGFKSKASFYRVFKLHEGMTPGEYQQSILA